MIVAGSHRLFADRMKQDDPYLLFFEPDTVEHEYSVKLRANDGVKMKRELFFLASTRCSSSSRQRRCWLAERLIWRRRRVLRYGYPVGTGSGSGANDMIFGVGCVASDCAACNWPETQHHGSVGGVRRALHAAVRACMAAL